MKTRQVIALEIRDLIAQINARVAELEEDGYKVLFVGNKSIRGKIQRVVIDKTTNL